jgi:hypothetical protein
MGVGKPLPELRPEISNMVKAYKLSTEISYKFGVQVPSTKESMQLDTENKNTYGQNPSKPNSNRSMIMKRSGC